MIIETTHAGHRVRIITLTEGEGINDCKIWFWGCTCVIPLHMVRPEDVGNRQDLPGVFVCHAAVICFRPTRKLISAAFAGRTELLAV